MNPAAPPPPGAGSSAIRLPAGHWPSVLAFLTAHFAHVPATEWRSRCARGLVTDEHGVQVDAGTAYRPGMLIRYFRELRYEAPIPFAADILYRDDHLLVADKPHFLPVIPAGRYVRETLLARLKQETGLQELVPLHRIDRGTAGLVLFSTRADTRARYQALFPQRAIRKVYEALAPHLPSMSFPRLHRSRVEAGEPFFRMRETGGAPNSETRIGIARRCGSVDLYRLEPLTGRKHQLRVHLAALGAPIVNDPLYPALQPEAEDDYTRPLCLLARTLEFDDPVSGQPRRFDSRRRLPAE